MDTGDLLALPGGNYFLLVFFFTVELIRGLLGDGGSVVW